MTPSSYTPSRQKDAEFEICDSLDMVKTIIVEKLFHFFEHFALEKYAATPVEV